MSSYHGERHPVNLMFVFGLVLSEGAVPGGEETNGTLTGRTGEVRSSGGDQNRT